MPDRRQHDRRESSGLNSKKLSVSLGNFVLLIIVFLLLVCSIILCRVFYTKGYNNGNIDGYDAGRDEGYSQRFF